MELKLTPEEAGNIVLQWAAGLCHFSSETKTVFNNIEFETSSYGSRFTGVTLTYTEPQPQKDGDKDE